MAQKKDSNSPAVTQASVKGIPQAIFEKLQTIAMSEGVSFNEVYNLAFAKFVEIYENKNGPVKPRAKGKGLKGL